MTHKLWVDCGLEIKQADADGYIEGHGAVFGNVDFGLDRIEPGAFTQTLKGLDSVPMLWQHFSDEPIGVWEGLSEDKRGLVVKGHINLDTQRGREARSLVKQGAVRGLSIGYIPRDFKYEDDVRVLKVVDLLEVSLATFPMNPEARVAGVKNDTYKVLEGRLREEFGMSRRDANKTARFIRTLGEERQTAKTSDIEDNLLREVLQKWKPK